MGRCVAGQTKTFGIELGSVANAGKFQVAPTIEAADFRISINGGAFTALTNTPTVSPAGGAQVVVVLAAAETTAAGAGGRIHFRASDSSGLEWQDLAIDLDVYATAEDTLVATVTNLTNAPTNGDLTATMKTSVTTAATAATPTAAAVTGAVGSVTGNVGGNVVGSVASVTAGVTLATGAITADAIATDAIDADAIAADAVTEIRSGLLTTSAFDTKLGTPAGASVSADIAAVKTETAIIQTDTNDLQTQIGTAGAGLTAVASAANLTTLAGYVDTEIAQILAAVDIEIATLVTNVAAILADTGTDGVVLSTAQMQALADIILARSSANVDNTAATNSLYEAIGFLKRASTATGNLVIYKTDGTTVFSTTVLGTNVDAVPIERIGVAA